MILVVFRSRLNPEHLEEYAEIAPRVSEAARQIPGLLSFKTFAAGDGERVTIAEFESEEAVAIWREDALHQTAQKQGREAFYAEYHIQICDVLRANDFRATQTAALD